MLLPRLHKAKLIKRYKRFLADVILDTGETVVCHCPNSGSMMGLKEEGLTVFVSEAVNPNAKLNYKLELVENSNGVLVGINTMLTNKLVKEALDNKFIQEVMQYDYIKPESKFCDSRFDFLLKNNVEECYLEVKNVTLSRGNYCAEFPDAKTQRGSKHIKDLIQAKASGKRAINLYIIQREDTTSFRIAKDIDDEYHKNICEAKKSGVEFLCYSCKVSKNNIIIDKAINILL